MAFQIEIYLQHTFNLNSTDELHGTGKQSAFEEGFGGTNLTNDLWLGLDPLRRYVDRLKIEANAITSSLNQLIILQYNAMSS